MPKGAISGREYREMGEAIKRDRRGDRRYRHIDYQPGNGTRYEVSLYPATDTGRMLMVLSNFHWPSGAVKAMEIWAEDRFRNPREIQETLDVYDGDAEALALLLNHVFSEGGL